MKSRAGTRTPKTDVEAYEYWIQGYWKDTSIALNMVKGSKIKLFTFMSNIMCQDALQENEWLEHRTKWKNRKTYMSILSKWDLNTTCIVCWSHSRQGQPLCGTGKPASASCAKIFSSCQHVTFCCFIASSHWVLLVARVQHADTLLILLFSAPWKVNLHVDPQVDFYSIWHPKVIVHLVLFTLHDRRMNFDLLGMSNSKERTHHRLQGHCNPPHTNSSIGCDTQWPRKGVAYGLLDV